ncbi:MAG: HEAT repeat domain-containing protein [Bacteroidota bacterium]|nr:HEAT repeat domain-containing protein [Bacteroidota bacterium]
MFTLSHPPVQEFSGGAKGDTGLIAASVKKLASNNAHERLAARTALERAGAAAVQPLIKALNNDDEIVRWEAAKALGEIGDRSAAEALVQALTDKSFDVRWVAAESLIALGETGVPALLEALAHLHASVMLYRQAHHILHSLSNGPMPIEVRNVLKALEKSAANIHVPVAAYTALEFLRSKKGEAPIKG